MQTPSHEDAVPDGLTNRRRQRKGTERVGEGSLTLAVVHLEGNHRADDDPQREPAYSRDYRSRWELGDEETMPPLTTKRAIEGVRFR